MQKIELQNRNGRIGTQFSVNGQRYSLYGLGNWESGSDRAKATALIRVIEGDILEHCFDASLERYKAGLRRAARSLGKPSEAFALWLEQVKPSDRNYAVHYEPVLRALLTSPNSAFTDSRLTEGWLHLSSSTYNNRIGVLKRFGTWLVSEGYLPLNPYRRLKNKPSQVKKVQPLNAYQVQALLAELYRRSTMVGAYYEFLFRTGCRPSEAIGLLKDEVHTDLGVICISSALARGSTGLSGSPTRIRKGTKTGDIRTLPLSDSLRATIELALKWQLEHALETELVFCNSLGTALDDVNLAARHWKPALLKCGIPYQKPYITRHTAASMLLENGGTLADAAKLLGHKDLRMVASHYGHAVKEVQLPSYS